MMAGMTTRFNRIFRLAALPALALALHSCSLPPDEGVVRNAGNLLRSDLYTLVGDRNFLTRYEPLAADGDVNVVVEIPTGTIAKWEVVKPTGELKWEFRKGKPRRVEYLGYPGNYGMVPRTLLSKESGGDGDPLDVIVLGPAVPRGSVIKAKLIGVLKLLDGGERDDKLIAVLRDSPFYEVGSLDELNTEFNGVTDILQTWFSNYKGPGETEAKGFGDEREAKRILDAAIKEFSGSGNAP